MVAAARARVPVVRLELVRDSQVAAPTKYVKESRDVAEILRQLIGWADREHLAVVLEGCRPCHRRRVAAPVDPGQPMRAVG